MGPRGCCLGCVCVCAGATVGDLVWVDSNGNGLQDAGEPGLAGVSVELRQGGVVIATATTDSSGHYSFGNVAPGTYTVLVHRPSGYSFSPGLQGSDRTLDSDVSPSSGETSPFTVSAGQALNSVDAGLFPGVCATCITVSICLKDIFSSNMDVWLVLQVRRSAVAYNLWNVV